MVRRLAFLSAVAGLALSNLANAQEVSSTKTGIASKVSSQTGNVQLRHYDFGKYDADGSSTDYIMTQVRGNFTVGLYKDFITSTLTLALSKASDASQQVYQRRPRVWTEMALVNTKYFTFAPYLDLHGPQTGLGTRGDLGIIPKVTTTPITTAVGNFTANAWVEAESQFTSRPQDAKIVNAGDRQDDRYGLSAAEGSEDKDTLEGGKKDASYEADFVTELDLKVAGAKGLGLNLQGWYYNEFNPVYKLEEDGTRETIWTVNRFMETWYGVNYAINDVWTVSNIFITTHGGFYQREQNVADGVGNGATRYTNWAMLTAKLY